MYEVASETELYVKSIFKDSNFAKPCSSKLNVVQSISNSKFSMSTATHSSKLIAIFEICWHVRKILEMFERLSVVPSTFNSFNCVMEEMTFSRNSADIQYKLLTSRDVINSGQIHCLTNEPNEF